MEPLVVVRQPEKRSDSTAPIEPPTESLWSTWQRMWKPKGTAQTTFYGPGTRLTSNLGDLESPLVYVHEGTLTEMPDASVIETGLPIGRLKTRDVPDLPYWPSYRAALPEQRAVYWKWLLSGRSDPEISLGYVFIYFYGLERRALVDLKDFGIIADEVLRLTQIYNRSRSFVRYANSLLWTSIWLGIHEQGIPKRTLERALRAEGWSDKTRGLSLATLARLKVKISPTLAYQLTESDERSQRSVVTDRHAELHGQSFSRKFTERFPDGLRLRVPQDESRLEYFPASATLGRLTDAGGPLANQRVPSMAGLVEQLSPTVEIWGECIGELKAYDRAHQKAGGVELTASMYEALPESLREGDHPHFDAWYRLMEQHVTTDGWTLLPAGEVAKLEGISDRKKLTKTQSVQLAVTAGHMGLALEPDPRITGTPYLWDEFISIFPVTEELGQDVASYHAAALLLELGMTIAAADGQIDDVELQRLANHLETQFELSTQDSTRLEHLQYLLTHRPPQDLAAARTLQRTLTIEQRKVIGEFLVGIAAADSDISPLEVQALGRAYRALGLKSTDLDELLQFAAQTTPSDGIPTTPSADSTSGIQLDMARINAIMTETAQVAAFLREALRDEADVEEPTAIVEEAPVDATAPPATVSEPFLNSTISAELDSRWEGLGSRFHGFATAMIEHRRWPRGDVEALARREKLLPGAAIEAINEWAYDRFSDALLIESGDVIDVQQQILG